MSQCRRVLEAGLVYWRGFLAVPKIILAGDSIGAKQCILRICPGAEAIVFGKVWTTTYRFSSQFTMHCSLPAQKCRRCSCVCVMHEAGNRDVRLNCSRCYRTRCKGERDGSVPFPVDKGLSFKGVHSPHTHVVMAARVEVTFFQCEFQKRELDLITYWGQDSPCALYVLGVGLRKVWTSYCHTCSCVFYGYFSINIVCVIPASSAS